MSVDPSSTAPEAPRPAANSPPAARTDTNGATATAPVAAAPPAEEKRGFTFPSAYTVLFILLVAVAALTYVIPAGQYDRQDGQPIPNTYHTVPQNPQKLLSG